jgi:hypothetical protein
MTTNIIKKVRAVKVPKPAPEHRDKLNRLLTVGDFVAYPDHNSLEFGRVAKLNNVLVGVYPVLTTRYGNRNTNKYPSDLVRLDEKEMTWYILRNSK